MRRFTVPLFGVLVISTAGCIFHHVQVQQMRPSEAVAVTSPVKAHLKDGSTVVYANGVTVAGGALRGEGLRWDLALKQAATVNNVLLDSVVGMESYQTKVEGAKSAVAYFGDSHLNLEIVSRKILGRESTQPRIVCQRFRSDLRGTVQNVATIVRHLPE
ncbi:MAG: hypothetical protein IPM24_16600 [Bryobacterales bacterium]|nr:hypothetical protein [Bryobacterales bacterium]